MHSALWDTLVLSLIKHPGKLPEEAEGLERRVWGIQIH